MHDISNNVVCATSKASDQPAHTRSLIGALAAHLSILWLSSCWLDSIWSFWAWRGAAGARPGLHVSECRIVGDLMSQLICKLWLQPMSIVDACYLNPIYRNGTLCNPLSAVLICWCHCKQSGPRTSPTSCWDLSGSYLFENLVICSTIRYYSGKWRVRNDLKIVDLLKAHYLLIFEGIYIQKLLAH